MPYVRYVDLSKQRNKLTNKPILSLERLLLKDYGLKCSFVQTEALVVRLKGLCAKTNWLAVKWQAQNISDPDWLVQLGSGRELAAEGGGWQLEANSSWKLAAEGRAIWSHRSVYEAGVRLSSTCKDMSPE